MDSDQTWPPEWFDPERFDLLTPATVSALTHPIRLTLLRLLRQDGPGTASGLASRIGHSSGVTSYHLRVLAEAGLVLEDAERGNRRDRWWRAAHEATTFTFRSAAGPGDTADLEVAEQYLRMISQVAYERVLGYVESLAERQDELAHLPWQLGETQLSLTHAEARALTGRLIELLDPYRTDLAGRGRGPGAADAVAAPGEERHRAYLQYQLVPDEVPPPDPPDPR